MNVHLVGFGVGRRLMRSAASGLDRLGGRRRALAAAAGSWPRSNCSGFWRARVQLRCAMVIGVWALVVAAGVPSAAGMGEDDKAGAKAVLKAGEGLDRARMSYEQKMERKTSEVRGKLKKMLDDAMSNKEGEQIKKAEQARDAFEQRGELPDHPFAKYWKSGYAAIAQEMGEAYKRTIEAYKKAKSPDLADAARRESVRFGTHWDLLPWREILNGDEHAEREVAPDEARSISLGLAAKPEYRLDIVGTRDGDKGELSVEIPLADGRRLKIPVIADEHGKFHILLTVRKDMVCADLGVPRPVSVDKAVKKDGLDVTFEAKDGVFSIDALRVKPVVAGKPPEVEKKPAKNPAKEPEKKAAQPLDAFTRGSLVTGVLEDVTLHAARPPKAVDGRVESISASRVVICDDTQHFRYYFKRDGNTLVLDGDPETTGNPVKLQGASGTGSITGNVIQWDVQGHTVRGNNRNDMVVFSWRYSNVRIRG